MSNSSTTGRFINLPFRSIRRVQERRTSAKSAPGAFADVVAASARLERDLNEVISRRIRELNETHSTKTTIAILLLSFIYGVFHAIGPGHGKVVVASYFVAHRERWLNSVLFGSLISLVQGVSAVLIVGALGLILRWSQFEVLGQVATVQVVLSTL